MRAACVVLGLGDRLAGDDGVGPRVIDALRGDPRLPAGVDLVEAGTDLLRLVPELEGRSIVVLVDAVLDPDRCGQVGRTTDASGFAACHSHAHHLSAVQAMALMRAVDPALAGTPCVWITVGVRSVAMSPTLSPELACALPGIVDSIVAILTDVTAEQPLAG